MYEHRGFDDDPDPYFCNSELYSCAENADDWENVENRFYFLSEIRRFCLKFGSFLSLVRHTAYKTWHRLSSMRHANNGGLDDIPF